MESERLLGRTLAARWLRAVWVWGPAAVVMVAIYATSSVGDLSGLPVDVPDKLSHFCAYALLGACVLWGLADANLTTVTAARAMWAWGITVTYGASDEWHQSFVPGRTMAVDDWLADGAGAAAAIGLVLVLVGRRPRSGRAV